MFHSPEVIAISARRHLCRPTHYVGGGNKNTLILSPYPCVKDGVSKGENRQREEKENDQRKYKYLCL